MLGSSSNKDFKSWEILWSLVTFENQSRLRLGSLVKWGEVKIYWLSTCKFILGGYIAIAYIKALWVFNPRTMWDVYQIVYILSNPVKPVACEETQFSDWKHPLILEPNIDLSVWIIYSEELDLHWEGWAIKISFMNINKSKLLPLCVVLDAIFRHRNYWYVHELCGWYLWWDDGSGY